jgi:lipoate-protein ligase A
MNWRYINTGDSTGSFNMEFDMNLVKNINQGSIIFRLYRWSPYCISLGANQDFNDINYVKMMEDGIDLVKRPTGGRAILHSEEVTYSVVMSLDNTMSPRNIYHQINLALIEGLKIYDSGLTQLEIEGIQTDLLSFYKENLSAACFGVPSRNEIKYAGRKLVGSAQRKIGSTLLQHGSVMCGNYHVNLADYLNLSEYERMKVKEELESKTTDLETILNKKTDYEKLSESLVRGFEKFFAVKMLREELILNN